MHQSIVRSPPGRSLIRTVCFPVNDLHGPTLDRKRAFRSGGALCALTHQGKVMGWPSNEHQVVYL